MKSRIRPRIGLMALAVAASWGPAARPAAAQEVPEENRKEVVQALGPPFIVFREKVLEELQLHVREELGDPRGVLVLDPSSFLKKGHNSVGVKRPAMRSRSCFARSVSRS